VPVYQYTCTSCGEPLEVRQSFDDAALTQCPVCDGRLRKVLSAVGVVFKGSGFYRTDSRASNAHSNGTGSATSSDSNGGSSTGSKTTDSSKGSDGDSGSGNADKSASGTATSGQGSGSDKQLAVAR
jgi:putative FmdB family regulatory protein